MRRVLRVLLPVAAAALLVGITTPAYAAKPISVQPPTPCAGGQIMTGGTFTLTELQASDNKTISIQTDLDSTPQGPDSFDSETGTATYNETFDGVFQTATATVLSSWSGSFTLAPTCRLAAAANVTTSGSLPGTNPSIAITVANPNDIMITYTVSAVSLGNKTGQKVLAHRSLEVDFAAACGVTYSVTVAGNDGTQRNASVATAACAPPPPKPHSPSTSPSPSKSAKASASPSASPSASAADSTSASDPSTTNPTQTTSPTPFATKSNIGGLPSGWLIWTGACMVVLGAAVLGVMWLRRREPEAAI